MKPKSAELFYKTPVLKALMQSCIPATAAMILVLIYNLADTFFIGQTHNDLLVAAVSLATPVFFIFISAGSVFGIGGASVISRSLGGKKKEYAKKVCSFCMWGCVAVGIILTAGFLIFMDGILHLIGASPETLFPAKTYLTIVSVGGVFILISNCYSNLLRAEGASAKAMMGQIIGNVLNIVLDPLFILILDWGITGAAIATVIGNVFAALYYILYYTKGKSELSIHPKYCAIKGSVPKHVLAVGVPASLGSLFMSLSQIIVNTLMSSYGDMAIAGIGVAMKITMITGILCIGFGQGVQPLLGYCTGAKLRNRFNTVMKYSVIFAFVLSGILTAVCFIFTETIVGVFLSEPSAYEYAVLFTKILLTTSFLFGFFYVMLNAIQAIGDGTAALIVNISRQGLIYIPLLFLLKRTVGAAGLAWAQPAADVLSTMMVIGLYNTACKRIMKT